MKRAVYIFIAAIACYSFTGCKKAVEDAQQQAVVNAITDGVWQITIFTEGGTDITSSFAGWEFTFFNNGTSVGNKTGLPAVTGIWSGDPVTYAFTTSFTSAAPAPLEKVVGTWTVTLVSSASKSKYSRTAGGVTYTMEMTKK